MSFPILECLDVNCWDYKTEGFDSIILCWIGPSESQFHGKVLRIFKNQEEKFRRGGGPEIHDYKDRVRVHQQYINQFIRPFLDSIDCGSPCSVTNEFLEAIAIKIQSKRPEKRIKEAHVCTTSTVALIHDDHILSDGFVIEIKPKWGFYPDSPLLPDDSIKRKVSCFQIMQRLKMKKGDIKEYSLYNPPDLFSETVDGVAKALDSIILNPQGNLKVFRSGSVSKLNANERDALIPVLTHLPVLKQLLRLQRLDIFNIECIGPVVEKANNPTWEELAFDEKVIHGVQSIMSSDYSPKTKDELQQMINNMDVNEARIQTACFLISQAAKDCSIMLVFPNDNNFTNSPSTYVIDFDLKMPEHIISHYQKADKNMVAAYMELEHL